ncbi:MAG TPA: hypothetical protein VHQ39_04875, partial [Dongiaceae bacterium]|nr:hypothetical protein [Dongiaceae bacterium]
KAAHAALAAAPHADALLFNAMMRPPSLAFHLLRPWLLYRRLARLSVSQGQGPTEGFRRFLAELWNLESPQQVPATAWRKFLAQFRANSAEG